jgi:hypothetical protein
MSALYDDEANLPVSKKLLLALRNAASYVQDAAKKNAVKAHTVEQTLERSAAA